MAISLNTLRKTYSTILFLATLLLAIVFTFHLFPGFQDELNLIAGQEIQSLDSRLYYNHADVQELFDVLGIRGRETMFFVSGIVDSIYPLTYGFLFYWMLSYLVSPIPFKWQTIIPFLVVPAVFFDYAENISVLLLLTNYPNLPAPLITMASAYTSLKWFFVFITLLSVLTLSIVRVTSYFRK